MSTIVCKRETSVLILKTLKQAGHLDWQTFVAKTGLSHGHIRSNLKAYINRGRVACNKIRGAYKYFWKAGDSEVVLGKTTSKAKVHARCLCGEPAYRNKSGDSVCRACDEKEQRLYGHRDYKCQHRGEFRDDQSLRKYITIYEMPANYTP